MTRVAYCWHSARSVGYRACGSPRTSTTGSQLAPKPPWLAAQPASSTDLAGFIFTVHPDFPWLPPYAHRLVLTIKTPFSVIRLHSPPLQG